LLLLVACFIGGRKKVVGKHIVATFSYPRVKQELMDKVEKLLGFEGRDKSFSRYIVELIEHDINRREGLPEPAKPTKGTIPLVTAPKEEWEEFLSELSIDELAGMMGAGHTINKLAEKYWKEKKFPSKKKQTFVEQLVAGHMGNGT
jgi:hypothetical protein